MTRFKELRIFRSKRDGQASHYNEQPELLMAVVRVALFPSVVAHSSRMATPASSILGHALEVSANPNWLKSCCKKNKITRHPGKKKKVRYACMIRVLPGISVRHFGTSERTNDDKPRMNTAAATARSGYVMLSRVGVIYNARSRTTARAQAT